MAGDKENFLAAGCTHYISKPFDKKTLIGLINKILNNKS
jgi:CheY-like chemotaxis protein